MRHHGLRGLEGIALAAGARQEGVADVDVLERVALDQAGQADRPAAVEPLHQVHRMAARALHRHRAVLDRLERILQGAHAAVADMFDEGRVVEDFQVDGGIARLHQAQAQARAARDFVRIYGRQAAHASTVGQ